MSAWFAMRHVLVPPSSPSFPQDMDLRHTALGLRPSERRAACPRRRTRADSSARVCAGAHALRPRARAASCGLWQLPDAAGLRRCSVLTRAVVIRVADSAHCTLALSPANRFNTVCPLLGPAPSGWKPTPQPSRSALAFCCLSPVATHLLSEVRNLCSVCNAHLQPSSFLEHRYSRQSLFGPCVDPTGRVEGDRPGLHILELHLSDERLTLNLEPQAIPSGHIEHVRPLRVHRMSNFGRWRERFWD